MCARSCAKSCVGGRFGMMLSLFLEDAKFLDQIPANHLPHILPFFSFLLFLLLLVLFFFDSFLASKQMPSPCLISTWALFAVTEKSIITCKPKHFRAQKDNYAFFPKKSHLAKPLLPMFQLSVPVLQIKAPLRGKKI